MKQLVISGVTYYAVLHDIEPASVTPVLRGFRITLEAPDDATREQWVERMIEVASDLAWDDEKTGVVEQIYKDVERADKAAGKQEYASTGRA